MADVVAETRAMAAPAQSVGTVRRIVHEPAAVVGFTLLLIVIVGGLVWPFLTPYAPDEIHAPYRLVDPGGQFWLGTDELGRDLLSRAMYGARSSLTVSVCAVLGATLIGVPLGMIAGYYGRWLDSVVMRAMDVLFAFPAILLALLVVALLGPGVVNLVLALIVVYVPAFARIARGSTMSVAAEQFVEAQRAMGQPDWRILTRHIGPNIVAPIIVQISVSLAYAILVEASLSFLGLGLQPPAPSWGAMLSVGILYLQDSPWPVLVPGICLFISVLAFNLLGDGLRDVLDPRLRSGRIGPHD